MCLTGRAGDRALARPVLSREQSYDAAFSTATLLLKACSTAWAHNPHATWLGPSKYNVCTEWCTFEADATSSRLGQWHMQPQRAPCFVRLSEQLLPCAVRPQGRRCAGAAAPRLLAADWPSASSALRRRWRMQRCCPLQGISALLTLLRTITGTQSSGHAESWDCTSATQAAYTYMHCLIRSCMVPDKCLRCSRGAAQGPTLCSLYRSASKDPQEMSSFHRAAESSTTSNRVS